MNKKIEQDSGKDPVQDPKEDLSENLIFSVSELANVAEGQTDRYDTDTPVSFDKEGDEDPVKAKSNLKGTIRIMRINREFNIQIHDMEIDVELECDKCLEPHIQKIEIPHAEIEFLIKPSQDIESNEDIFFVNTKNWTVDLNEFIRQEIILHFPLISVCSTHI